MTVFNNVLEKLKKEKTLIDLFRDEIVDNCLTGVITDYNHSFCYLNLIEEDGTNDGVSIIKIEDITRIRWEGNARESILILMKDKKTKLLSPTIKLDSFRTVIESVQENFGYLNIHTEYMDDDVCFIGEVEEIDDEHLLIHEFGTMTSRDRHRLLVPIEQISRVDAEAQYEKDIVFLGGHAR